MPSRPPAFTPPADAPGWQRWLLFSPAARIVVFVAVMLLAGGALGFVLSALGFSGAGASPLGQAMPQLALRAVPPLFAYLVLVCLVERRRPLELAPRRIVPDGLAGIAGGAVLFSAVVGLLWLSGSYHVSGTHAHIAWLPALLMVGLGAGIGEEIIFRGVLFRIVEEGLGTGVALLVSALVFGGMHIANPGATVWSSASIAIEAGLLFGLLYHVTRSLPACMGAHAAWNFTQGTVYGIPVSGMAADGWLVSNRSGPAWLSGGVFGAEASVVALALCVCVSTGLLWLAWRRGTLVPVVGGWRRATSRPLRGIPVDP